MHHITTSTLNELLRQQRELCYQHLEEHGQGASDFCNFDDTPSPPLPSEDDSIDAEGILNQYFAPYPIKPESFKLVLRAMEQYASQREESKMKELTEAKELLRMINGCELKGNEVAERIKNFLKK